MARHNGAFSGRQLKKWLDTTGENGVETAKKLLEKNFITSVQKNVTDFRDDGLGLNTKKYYRQKMNKGGKNCTSHFFLFRRVDS